MVGVAWENRHWWLDVVLSVVLLVAVFLLLILNFEMQIVLVRHKYCILQNEMKAFSWTMGHFLLIKPVFFCYIAIEGTVNILLVTLGEDCEQQGALGMPGQQNNQSQLFMFGSFWRKTTATNKTLHPKISGNIVSMKKKTQQQGTFVYPKIPAALQQMYPNKIKCTVGLIE